MCVQRFDDSRKSAIHITYRISLRSSSMREPRDPLLKVLKIILNLIKQIDLIFKKQFNKILKFIQVSGPTCLQAKPKQ